MPTIYFTDDPSNSYTFPPLQPRQQEVIKVYFATKKSEAKYKDKETEHITKKGETISKIAKKYKVKPSAVKRTKTTKYLQVGEKVIVTTKEKIGDKVSFKKLERAIIGEEAYIVVETMHLENEYVLLNILQAKEDALVNINKEITVQYNGSETKLIETQVGNYLNDNNITNKEDFENFAIAKVTLQRKEEEEQQEWKEALECASENKVNLYVLVDVHSKNSIPNFKWEYALYQGTKADDNPIPNRFLNTKEEWFELRENKVIDIYHTGEISKVDLKDAEKLSYIYHDKDGEKHELGSFDLIEVNELKNGTKLTSVPEGYTEEETISNEREKYTYADKLVVKGTKGDEKGKIRQYVKTGKKILLVKIDNNLDHTQDKITIKFKLMTGGTRPYINPNALACALGAAAEVGYKDITLIGFTSEDNHGFPSTTHVNGENGDFRYLRTDETGKKLDISTDPDDLDVERQEKMIDAFNNFGWEKFYSVYYTIDDESKILKLSDKSPGHHNHLHTRLLTPNFKK